VASEPEQAAPLPYLLEVTLAREAVEVWEAWRPGQTQSLEDKVAAVIFSRGTQTIFEHSNAAGPKRSQRAEIAAKLVGSPRPKRGKNRHAEGLRCDRLPLTADEAA
jgi:hypothetical protein